MLKKISILCLVFLILLGTVACGKEIQPNNETEAVTEKETETTVETDEWGRPVEKSNLPNNLNFGEKDVNFLVRSGEHYYREWTCDSVTDSLSQEIINRNQKVEEDLHVTLNFRKQVEGTQCASINSEIITAAQAGLGEIDIVSNYCAYGTTQALMDHYINFYDSRLTYLDLERSWWNQTFISASTAFGKMFFLVGDVNLSVYDRTMVTYFNQTLCEKYEITDLYESVYNGDWTYELLYNYTKDIYQDLDESNSKTTSDMFGLTSIRASEASDGFLYGFDCHLVTADVDGSHSLVGKTERTKLDSAMTKLITLYYSNGAMLQGSTNDNIQTFTEGHALFNVDVIYHTASTNAAIREMTDSYGILPIPKYDKEQTKYYSGVQEAHNVISIVKQPDDTEYDRISAVLEAMCCLSYSTVRPYYYEKIIKYQYMKDSDSGKIFDMILENCYWDFADIYSASVEFPRKKLWRNVLSQSGTIVGAFESNEVLINTALQNLDQYLVLHK